MLPRAHSLIADFANWDNSTIKEDLETSRAFTEATYEDFGRSNAAPEDAEPRSNIDFLMHFEPYRSLLAREELLIDQQELFGHAMHVVSIEPRSYASAHVS